MNEKLLYFILGLAFGFLLAPDDAEAYSLSEIASYAAGKPVVALCDADVNPPPGIKFPVEGWSWVPANEIHVMPEHCRNISKRPALDTESFAYSLGILIHEARHAAGTWKEACAEAQVRQILKPILRKFWSIRPKSGLETNIFLDWEFHNSLNPGHRWQGC